MKTIIIFSLFIFLMSLSGFSQTQEKKISGVVTTFDSIAVIGASIQVKSSKQIVLSDSLGHFFINVSNSDKLKVTAKGFDTRKVELTKQTKLVAVNLKLKAGDKAREYAIGYGHISDVEKLNAMSQLSNDDVDFSQYPNMAALLSGRFPGVQVQGNGDVLIRGSNSFNLDNAALIVIDGLATHKSELKSLVPGNVSSISILKGVSAAIYGSRGANGVVLIEMKTGKED